MTPDKQKLALLTGAAGVLGHETARGLAADGYRVIMVDLDGNKLETLARDIGAGAFPLVLDVADPQKVAEACEKIRQDLGQVSVLINNAGVLSNHKAADTTSAEWRRILAINLDGAFYLCREWLPSMKANNWGRIINMLIGYEDRRFNGRDSLYHLQRGHGFPDVFAGPGIRGAWRYREWHRPGLHQDPDGDGTID